MESLSSFSLQVQQPARETNPTHPPPPPPSHTSALHSVRKPPAKPWKRQEPPPPKVYHVNPRGFRRLVQKLTGAPRPQPNSNPRPLRDTLVPPPPLNLAPRSLPPLLLDLVPRALPRPPPHPAFDYNWSGSELISAAPVYEVQTIKPPPTTPKAAADTSLLGLLSPSFYSLYPTWCPFPFLSPGTMASLEPSSNPVL